MAQAQQASMDPLQMIMQAADRIGNAAVEAAGALVGFTAQHAPGAIGSTVNAGISLAGGINDAVRGATESLGSNAIPSASSNPFAGLDLGGALAGLRSCSVGNDGPELGQLSAPLANMAQMRSTGASMSL